VPPFPLAFFPAADARSAFVTLVEKAAWKLYRLAHCRLWTRRTLCRLKRSRAPFSEELAQATEDALRRDASLPPEEAGRLERIEAVRSELARSEERITLFGETVSVAKMGTGSSKGRNWALLLYRILRRFRPTSCVELGTCLGLSGAYQAAALKSNGAGRLVTIEGSDDAAAIARETTFARAGLGDTAEVVAGRFQDVLPDVLHRRAPVDYAFIDGHHEQDATLAYFDQLLPHLSAPALLVFDDIRWSDGMTAAWRQIQRHPRVRLAVDFVMMGVCVVGAPRADEEHPNAAHFKMALW
jgi:predicted O-methyltransferase YrrM